MCKLCIPLARPLLAAALLAIGTTGATAAAARADDDAGNEARLLANTRQLIFEGRRSGEGYFSADGRQMVFQSERAPGNPFYQIYLMDLETGDTTRISPGIGKTTCGWIHPDGGRVLFASTHEDPDALAAQRAELEKRASGQGSRYFWSFDPAYEIYEADTDGNLLRRLTHARGYDAEGSWSPDGRTILFASNRDAYARALSAEERKALAEDASRFMDIYVMDADGGNVRRLTDAPGYDGGPFFSADGRRIVWRRFDLSGRVAEIWTMNADGSDQRQITHLGVMSWAPYFHPSGDYIIFSNNARGYGNFELYIVDAEGRSKPVRVTFTDGFDGLPVFTPDGKQLAWSSARTPGGEPQIYIADWDDAAARKLLGLPPAASQTPDAATAPAATSPEIRPEDLATHVRALTAAPMAGRLTGTEGARLATDYVAAVMARIGLAPAGDLGGWFQRYRFTSGVSLADGNRLTLTSGDGAAVQLAADRDWRPLAFSGTGTAAPAGVVFAGYGIVAPGDDEHAAYNSYRDLDVSGQWVLALRYLPEDVSPQRRQYLDQYAEPRFKAMVAREHGARGLILASGPSARVKHQLIALENEAGAGSGSLPVISVTDAVAQQLLDAAGKKLADVQRALDAGEPAAGFALPGPRLGADIRLHLEHATDRNVLGRLVAGGSPSDQVVMIGAHADHIGTGIGLESRDPDAGKVHPGADDNASGVAALLEIAEDMAARRARGELALKHDIVFAAWTGEELGRLGSSALVEQLADGGDDITDQVLAYLNMDMVGRLTKQLSVQGVGSSPLWRVELERGNAPVGLPLRLQEDAYLPTDSTSFYLAGVPVLSFFTGVHADYNTSHDTADRLNYTGLGRVARLVDRLTAAVASREEGPEYVAQEKPGTGASRAHLRAYLGTIPDYAGNEVKGVLLDGVAKGGPAERGGLRAGDVVVAVAGRRIENIYDYTYALNALKLDEPVTVTVRRGGEERKLSVVPVARE
ncbi:MAG: M20/M25/M40 family metallo-hydrolase [Thiohalocapsa sp.]|jgi:Tol biopolymer transport system component|uniref:M28 family peptidase n=1 Tax=Thiohalocapsa sp. TaxID=2497641 RepID=UPI0025FCB586|nr:M28 family peptidase [Thiohalocapsa sp.]MCG6942854.1 M20/M25/M40 family metallo-hydrolase [Thiohalocapsa sp.]